MKTLWKTKILLFFWKMWRCQWITNRIWLWSKISSIWLIGWISQKLRKTSNFEGWWTSETVININFNEFYQTIFCLACYMNSFLQCLYMTQGFRNNLLKIKFDFESNPMNQGQPQGISLEKLKKVAPAYQLQRLFALLFQSKRLAINPTFFRNVLPDFFRMSYMQQDASEFAKIYLDSFEMALKNTKREV